MRVEVAAEGAAHRPYRTQPQFLQGWQVRQRPGLDERQDIRRPARQGPADLAKPVPEECYQSRLERGQPGSLGATLTDGRQRAPVAKERQPEPQCPPTAQRAPQPVGKAAILRSGERDVRTAPGYFFKHGQDPWFAPQAPTAGRWTA